jgi:hypothetical protein
MANKSQWADAIPQLVDQRPLESVTKQGSATFDHQNNDLVALRASRVYSIDLDSTPQRVWEFCIDW